MGKVKKFISLLLCFSVLNSFTVFAEQVEEKAKRVVEVNLDGEKQSLVNCEVSTHYMTLEKVDNRLVYTQDLPANTWPTWYARLYINIDDEYWYSTEPHNVKVTMQYKDVENDSISIHYNSPIGGNWTFKECLATEGTNEWKTYELFLDDFAPCNDLQYGGNCDLVIYAAGWNYDRPGQTVIGSIKIEENVYESEIVSDVGNGYVGRMFGYGESDEMYVTLTNTVEDDYTASAEYTIIDSEGKTVDAGKIPDTVIAVGMYETITLNTGIKDCGIYNFCLDVTVSKNGEVVDTYQKNISILGNKNTKW